ncbi:histidine kinase dimerization/phospho-acceptor domain-containing protein [Streptomyces sp. V4I23]|uniref:histidine kinase dimerization/phospho-acceptor domain-containing protein n=1 Tax=Streptomyces sp. V4I23 TaxID=3042282 RepID=UPI00358E79BD
MTAGGRGRPWSLRTRLVVSAVLLIAVVCAVIGTVAAAVASTQSEPDALGPTEDPLTAAQRDALASVARDGEPHTVELPDRGDYRVEYADGVRGSFLVGVPTRDVRDALRTLILVEVCVTGAGLVAAGIAGASMVGVALRPLRRVAATARRVSELPLHSGEVALHERVPDAEADPRTEVGQVGAALNTLLGHVGSALTARQESETRVRRFVADASHELRTPLASIRGYAELTRRGRERNEAEAPPGGRPGGRDAVPPDTRHALRGCVRRWRSAASWPRRGCCSRSGPGGGRRWPRPGWVSSSRWRARRRTRSRPWARPTRVRSSRRGPRWRAAGAARADPAAGAAPGRRRAGRRTVGRAAGPTARRAAGCSLRGSRAGAARARRRAGGKMPAGAPSRGDGGLGGLLGGTTVDAATAARIEQDADDFTWAAAAVGSQNAASHQLATGEPVMAIGGFNGSDPSPTLAQFKQYVADGRIHWFVSAGDGMRNGPGGGTAAQITAWVEENFTEVTGGGTALYDLTAAS